MTKETIIPETGVCEAVKALHDPPFREIQPGYD